MHAAGHFTSREEARDNLTILAINLGLRVDLDTAHAVVHGRGHDDGVERSLVERTGQVSAAELLVVLGGHSSSVFRHGLLEGSSRNLHLGSDFIKGVARDGVALLDVVVRGLQGLLHIRVEEEERVLVGLLQNGGRNVVAGLELVVEALAFVIHENGAVAADSFSDHFAVARNHRRVGLDLGHIDQLGTGLFSRGLRFFVRLRHFLHLVPYPFNLL